MGDQAEFEKRFQNVINQAREGNPEAQYTLGIFYSNRDIDVSLKWMNRSIEGGHVGAIYTLGAWYIQGTLIEEDLEKGHQMLKHASDLKFSDAALMRAALIANGIGVKASWPEALELVLESAEGGYSRAISQLAFLCWMEGSKKAREEESKLLQAAAEAGDMIAMYTYAKRVLESGAGDKPKAGAVVLMALAAKAGHPFAENHPAIQGVPIPEEMPQASDIFEEINWTTVREVLARPPIPPTPKAKVLRKDPYIATFPGFCTEDETDYVVAMSARHVSPSQIMDPISGKQIEDPYRSSSDMRFWHTFQDLVIFCINLRIAKATGEPLSHQEMLGVLRYEPGQQYKPHGDYLLPDMQGRNPEVDRSGQRIKTFLIYLNDDYIGGETEFVNIDIRARGAKGEGLVFYNVSDDGTPNPKTIHAGRPVTGGVKWLTTMWIRDREYRFRD
jgi:hypothetical protein